VVRRLEADPGKSRNLASRRVSRRRFDLGAQQPGQFLQHRLRFTRRGGSPEGTCRAMTEAGLIRHALPVHARRRASTAAPAPLPANAPASNGRAMVSIVFAKVRAARGESVSDAFPTDRQTRPPDKIPRQPSMSSYGKSDHWCSGSRWAFSQSRFDGPLCKGA